MCGCSSYTDGWPSFFPRNKGFSAIRQWRGRNRPLLYNTKKTAAADLVGPWSRFVDPLRVIL